MEIELEDWEAEIPVSDGIVVVADPPDKDNFELEVFSGEEWVRIDVTRLEMRQIHTAIGVLLG